MADFYVKYGSSSAKLLAHYKVGKINLKLHKVNENLFVISKNRKILFKEFNINDACRHFNSAVYLEGCAPLLFNF